MAPSIAGYTWHDAYNFAIVSPGQASAAILLAWPLFIAFAAVCVVLSPIAFPGAMLVAYVLNQRGAQPVEKPRPKAVANLGEFPTAIRVSRPVVARRLPGSHTAAPSHSFFPPIRSGFDSLTR